MNLIRVAVATATSGLHVFRRSVLQIPLGHAKRVSRTTAPPTASARWVGVRFFHFLVERGMPVVLR